MLNVCNLLRSRPIFWFLRFLFLVGLVVILSFGFVVLAVFVLVIVVFVVVVIVVVVVAVFDDGCDGFCDDLTVT